MCIEALLVVAKYWKQIVSINAWMDKQSIEQEIITQQCKKKKNAHTQ